MMITVWGDSAEGTLHEARAYADELRLLLSKPPAKGDARSAESVADEVVVRDRLSSRKGAFSRVVAWGLVEPRVVTIEKPRAAAPLEAGELRARIPAYMVPEQVAGLLERVCR
jgi:hypothetical protein